MAKTETIIERWPHVVPLKGGRLVLCSEYRGYVAVVMYQYRDKGDGGWSRGSTRSPSLADAVAGACEQIRIQSAGSVGRGQYVERTTRGPAAPTPLSREITAYIRATDWGERLP